MSRRAFHFHFLLIDTPDALLPSLRISLAGQSCQNGREEVEPQSGR
jgi:hypothetical protein